LSTTLWYFLRSANGGWHRWPTTKAGPVLTGDAPVPKECGTSIVTLQLVLELADRKPRRIISASFYKYPVADNRRLPITTMMADAVASIHIPAALIEGVIPIRDVQDESTYRRKYGYEPTSEDLDALREHLAPIINNPATHLRLLE